MAAFIAAVWPGSPSSGESRPLTALTLPATSSTAITEAPEALRRSSRTSRTVASSKRGVITVARTRLSSASRRTCQGLGALARPGPCPGPRPLAQGLLVEARQRPLEGALVNQEATAASATMARPGPTSTARVALARSGERGARARGVMGGVGTDRIMDPSSTALCRTVCSPLWICISGEDHVAGCLHPHPVGPMGTDRGPRPRPAVVDEDGGVGRQVLEAQGAGGLASSKSCADGPAATVMRREAVV
jgi:hypothetical protein